VQEKNADVLPDTGAQINKGTSAERLDRRTVGAIQFFAIFAAVWMVLNVCYQRFPLIRPGADVMTYSKFNELVTEPLFLPSDHRRRVGQRRAFVQPGAAGRVAFPADPARRPAGR
jgi:hypothetical protein